MKQIENRLIFKISLLSISLFLMMAPQISSALPLMYQAFPEVNQSSVEMLSTIPNFGIIAGLVISPILIRLIKQKHTVLVGLMVTLLAGTAPLYLTSYLPILFSRFLLGVGIGLFNSLAVSLLPKFYKDSEEQLATMLSFQNVMGAIGAAISSFLVSYLVTISWHAAFAIYLLVIPSFILFYVFIPNDSATQIKHSVSKGHASATKLNTKVILIAALIIPRTSIQSISYQSKDLNYQIKAVIKEKNQQIPLNFQVSKMSPVSWHRKNLTKRILLILYVCKITINMGQNLRLFW